MTTSASASAFSLKLPLTGSDFLRQVEKGKEFPLTIDVPFKKMEKVNRISDWSPSLFYSTTSSSSSSSSRAAADGQWKAMASQGPKQKSSSSTGGGGGGGPSATSTSTSTNSHTSSLGGRHHVVGSFKSSALRANALKRVLSCQIQKDWKLLEEIDFGRLSKLSLSVPRSIRSSRATYGGSAKSSMAKFDENEKFDVEENVISVISSHDSSKLPLYDSRLAERLTPRTERTVSVSELTTSSSAVGDKSGQSIDSKMFPPLSEELQRETVAHTTIYTSAPIASLLMASPHTVIPWDIIVRVTEDESDGSRIVILEAGSSSLSKAHVHETAIFKPAPISGTSNWSQQQQAVTAQQTKMSKKLEELTLENSNLSYLLPEILSSLQGNSASASAAADVDSCPEQPQRQSSQRHTMVSLGDGYFLRLVGDVDAVCSSSKGTNAGAAGEEESVLVSSLLECNTTNTSISAGSHGWRQKLDNQRGALLVQEFRDNTAYLARKAYQSLVMDVDRVAIGWFSRSSVADKHGLLAVQEYSPEEMVTQMNLNVENAFGILRALVDLFGKLPVGKEFRLLRDANRPLLKLYQVGTGNHYGDYFGSPSNNSTGTATTNTASMSVEDDIFSGVGDITKAMGHLNS